MAAKRKAQDELIEATDFIESETVGEGDDVGVVEPVVLQPVTPIQVETRFDGGRVRIDLIGVSGNQLKSASGEIALSLTGLTLWGQMNSAEALVYDAERRVLWRVSSDGKTASFIRA